MKWCIGLAPRAFKRLTGITKTTFAEMVVILRKAKTKEMSNGGKPSHLSIKDKLLMSVDEKRQAKARELLIRVVSMLIKMAQKS